MKYVIHGNFYIEGKLQCIKPCDFLYVGGVYMGTVSSGEFFLCGELFREIRTIRFNHDGCGKV
jgi:hypothetical protein